jgi:hypothetical protein
VKTDPVRLYSCYDYRLPRSYLTPKQDKSALVIIFVFKKHGKNGMTGRIPLGMPPHKRTKIKVFHSTKKTWFLWLIVTVGWTSRCGKNVLLLLQDNYFNFRFLDTSNTDNGRGEGQKLRMCTHKFHDVELPRNFGVREKLHLVYKRKEGAS